MLGICIRLKIRTGFEFSSALSGNEPEKGDTFSALSDSGLFYCYCCGFIMLFGVFFPSLSLEENTLTFGKVISKL